MARAQALIIGAGALGAASTQFEPYRPWFLGLTVILLGAAFTTTNRRVPTTARGPRRARRASGRAR